MSASGTDKVINPKTKRMIQVGKGVYNGLIREGYVLVNGELVLGGDSDENLSKVNKRKGSELQSDYGSRKIQTVKRIDEITFESTERMPGRASLHIFTWERLCKDERMAKRCEFEEMSVPDEGQYMKQEDDHPFKTIVKEMKSQCVDVQKGDIIQFRKREGCPCGESHDFIRNEHLYIFDGEEITTLGFGYGAGDGNIPWNNKYTVPDKFPTGYWDGIIGYFSYIEQMDPNLVDLIRKMDVTPGPPTCIHKLYKTVIEREDPETIHGHFDIIVNRQDNVVEYSTACRKNHNENDCYCERVIVSVCKIDYKGDKDDIQSVIEALNDKVRSVYYETEDALIYCDFLCEDSYSGPFTSPEYRYQKHIEQGLSDEVNGFPRVSVLVIS